MENEKRGGRLTLVVILAAAVAALTTLVFLFVRAYAKRKALNACAEDFEYDLYCDDDCDCDCDMDCDCVDDIAAGGDLDAE